MLDDMFFSQDLKSLHRGKRRAPRTDTCRPCLVWTQDDPENKLRGVVMDVSPHGVRVRMIETLSLETPVVVQLMRDEKFRVPLSVPVEGRVVRCDSSAGGLTDHGIALVRKEVRYTGFEPGRPAGPRRRVTGLHPRLHALDFTVGDSE